MTRRRWWSPRRPTPRPPRSCAIPFDGSGPVVVRTESTGDADFAPSSRALSVDGDRRARHRRHRRTAWEPPPSGRVEVWRYDGTTRTAVVTAPEGSRVEGGAIGPDGVLVCLTHPDQSRGCDTRYFPTTGAPSTGELPQSGLFWRTAGGFVQGCDGELAAPASHLYRVTTPDLDGLHPLPRRASRSTSGAGAESDRYAVAANVSTEVVLRQQHRRRLPGLGHRLRRRPVRRRPGRPDRRTHPAHHPRPDAGRHRGRSAPAHPVADLGRRGHRRGLRRRLPQGPDPRQPS